MEFIVNHTRKEIRLLASKDKVVAEFMKIAGWSNDVRFDTIHLGVDDSDAYDKIVAWIEDGKYNISEEDGRMFAYESVAMSQADSESQSSRGFLGWDNPGEAFDW